MTRNTIETVRITSIIEECEGIKTFVFMRNESSNPKPGQFVMVWVPGVDEIPMSISSYKKNGEWAITVKDVGECTNSILQLKVGDYIGVRGPLGNYFVTPRNTNKHLFLIGMVLMLLVINFSGCIDDTKANDSDGDGMHDGWEYNYSLDPTDPHDAYDDKDLDGVDYDGDGSFDSTWRNLDEYQFIHDKHFIPSSLAYA